jgi:transcriptional regulator of acetoin/glycerol metabolism
VFAQLGGAAASIASEVESLGGVVTVTDGHGRILTVQGDKETLRRARTATWRRGRAGRSGRPGTNGMGTALEAPGPVLISGPEHWCTGFRRVGLCRRGRSRRRDHDAVAVLDVSTWRANLPPRRPGGCPRR